jgi:hypothetical protein
MTTTTSYGTWNNHGDRGNVTVAASIADAINGGDADWRERMEASGALDRVEDAYRAAIDEALPQGVSLCGNEFIGPYYSDQSIEQQMAAFDDDEDPIASAVESADLQAIIEAHDVDNVPPTLTVTLAGDVSAFRDRTAGAVEGADAEVPAWIASNLAAGFALGTHIPEGGEAHVTSLELGVAVVEATGEAVHYCHECEGFADGHTVTLGSATEPVRDYTAARAGNACMLCLVPFVLGDVRCRTGFHGSCQVYCHAACANGGRKSRVAV